MSGPIEPPPTEFFAEARPSFGEGRVVLALADLRVEIAGLDASLVARLAETLGPWTAPGDGASAAIRIEVRRARTEYFIDPPSVAERNPVHVVCDGATVRYVAHRVAGRFATSGGGAEMVLAAGEFEPVERAVENFVRAVVAWYAVEHGGALLHAASAVHHERGYVFHGESGAGKTTLTRVSLRGRMLGDDVSLVLPHPGGGLALVGTPFRGAVAGPPVTGAYPLAACFRLVQAEQAEVAPVSRVQALSELVANLPFVVDALPTRPELIDRVRSAFEGIRLMHLRFRKDDSFWDAIERAGL